MEAMEATEATAVMVEELHKQKYCLLSKEGKKIAAIDASHVAKIAPVSMVAVANTQRRLDCSAKNMPSAI